MPDHARPLCWDRAKNLKSGTSAVTSPDGGREQEREGGREKEDKAGVPGSCRSLVQPLLGAVSAGLPMTEAGTFRLGLDRRALVEERK